MRICVNDQFSERREHTFSNLLTLLFIGFALTLVGLMLIIAAAVLSQGGSSSVGGLIFIGPIPIVFGSGPGAQWLILFAVVLAVLTIIMFLMLRRESYGAEV